MTSINLLPPEIKKKRQSSRQSNLVLSFCLTFLFVLGIILVLCLSGRITVGLSVRARVQEKEILQNQIQKQQKLAEAIILINDRAATLAEIEKSKITWSQITQAIGQATPPTVQVKSLTADVQGKPVFKATGMADSNRSVVQFKEDLESSKYFKDVILESLNQNQVEEKTIINFNLKFDLEAKGFPFVEKK